MTSGLFQKVPAAHIPMLFEKFEQCTVNKGEQIIHQDDVGDYFYVIKRGEVRIEKEIPGQPPQFQAKLGQADYFGQDALIGDVPRNASAIMESDGILMRLGRDDFQTLLEAPLLKFVKTDEVLHMLADKSRKTRLVDVRTPFEYKRSHPKGSVNVPLSILRQSMRKFSPDMRYITCCEGEDAANWPHIYSMSRVSTPVFTAKSN